MQNNIFVKNTTDMGRGVFARLPILEGHIIEECPCISVPYDITSACQHTVLRFYVFRGGPSEDILALGYGSLYNHAPEGVANAVYTYDGANNVITFTALRNIEEGEQVLINYGYNPLVELEKWKTRKAKDDMER